MRRRTIDGGIELISRSKRILTDGLITNRVLRADLTPSTVLCDHILVPAVADDATITSLGNMPILSALLPERTYIAKL